ncbi:MAG: hypothetical protein IJ711_11225 [Lachnospiraceae bacterium]|nr:hypothetical protein [Lachnospiraceae bacterium]
MKKILITTLLTVILISQSSSIAIAGKLQASSKCSKIPTAVSEYCKKYNIPVSNSKEFIDEVEKMIDARNGFRRTSSSSGSNPLKKDRYIPKSSTADIIWTNNPITPFNHVGLYTASNKITEALSNGVKTRTVGVKMPEYPFKIYKVTTKSNNNTRYSSATRNKVADWAKKQVNKKYDYGFADNKQNNSASNKKFNCSELVWKSWKFTANVDLDSNGGKGVYPNNIKDSNRTKLINQSN